MTTTAPGAERCCVHDGTRDEPTEGCSCYCHKPAKPVAERCSCDPIPACLACGHIKPFGVWSATNSSIGICVACRDLAQVNNGPCSEERGCYCAEVRDAR